jgi:cyclase
MATIASKWAYTRGLHDIGSGCYAYLQPDGSWGWSNAGLVTDSGESLLIDTLFDVPHTREMLDALRRAEPRAAARIGTVVNTHSNGDHCFGNELVADAEIIASKACAEEMREDGGTARILAMKRQIVETGATGKFADMFRSFDFENVHFTAPTTTFEGELTRRVGNKTVRLLEVGPAHTRGDVLAYVPDDRVIFTGDILFINLHPIIWAGPVGNWIKACNLILELDVETVVPGHGPITDKKGATAVRDYFEYITAEARKRYDAGMPMLEAAKDISLADYSTWGDAERIAVNVADLYREFSGGKISAGAADLFAMMAEVERSRHR